MSEEKLLSIPPATLHFTKQGKPLKSSPENGIIAWGRFSKHPNKWMQEFRTKVIDLQSWIFSIDGSFFGPELLAKDYEPLKKVTLYCTEYDVDSWEYGIKTISGYSIDLHIVGTTKTPEQLLKESLVTTDATFHTWPDAKGRFKIYTHRGSRTARFKFNQPKPTTCLNRLNLESASDWEPLKHYIQVTTDAGFGPIRKDICDLVKHISLKQVELDQHKELVRMGVEEPKIDVFYEADDDL